LSEKKFKFSYYMDLINIGLFTKPDFLNLFQ
jgi:hypothetical protein